MKTILLTSTTAQAEALEPSRRPTLSQRASTERPVILAITTMRQRLGKGKAQGSSSLSKATETAPMRALLHKTEAIARPNHSTNRVVAIIDTIILQRMSTLSNITTLGRQRSKLERSSRLPLQRLPTEKLNRL